MAGLHVYQELVGWRTGPRWGTSEGGQARIRSHTVEKPRPASTEANSAHLESRGLTLRQPTNIGLPVHALANTEKHDISALMGGPVGGERPRLRTTVAPRANADLLAALADPTHPDHEHLRAPRDFDPAHLDLKEMNLAVGSPRPLEDGEPDS